jgi:hypothetical protein
MEGILVRAVPEEQVIGAGKEVEWDKEVRRIQLQSR